MVPKADEDEQQVEQDGQEESLEVRMGGPSLLAETTQADANPAFYPQDAKSEALHGEAEKAGLGYPGPVIEEDEADQVPFNSPQQAAVAAQFSDDGPTVVEGGDQGAGGAPADVPARNASTAVWREYAVSGAPADNRYTQDEADAASRDEIANYYLGETG
jgi:hypothetical protein